MSLTDRGYANLSNAIVLQAVEDYRHIIRRLRKKSIDPKLLANYLETKQEIEQFFLGEWFSALTSVNGKKLLHRLQSEATL